MAKIVATAVVLLSFFVYLDATETKEACYLKNSDNCFQLYTKKHLRYSYALSDCAVRRKILSLPNNVTGLKVFSDIIKAEKGASHVNRPYVGVYKDKGVWFREDGQPFDPEMWDKGEPAVPNHRCAILNHQTGRLKTSNCFRARPYLCQSCYVQMDNECFLSPGVSEGFAYPAETEMCGFWSREYEDDIEPFEPVVIRSELFLADLVKSAQEEIESEYVWVSVSKANGKWLQGGGLPVKKSMWDEGEPKEIEKNITTRISDDEYYEDDSDDEYYEDDSDDEYYEDDSEYYDYKDDSDYEYYYEDDSDESFEDDSECAALSMTTGKLRIYDCTANFSVICQRNLRLVIDPTYGYQPTPAAHKVPYPLYTNRAVTTRVDATTWLLWLFALFCWTCVA